MPNQRDINLDIIRILACLMVIAMHAPIPNGNAIGIFNAALSYYTAPCIGLFFMVSGALLLPIKCNGIEFLKKRFAKIAGPTVFGVYSILHANIFSMAQARILLSLFYRFHSHRKATALCGLCTHWQGYTLLPRLLVLGWNVHQKKRLKYIYQFGC